MMDTLPQRIGESETVTGETTDAYVDALDWNVLGLGSKTVVIRNTDVANALLYRLYLRTKYDGGDHEEISPTALAPADEDRISITKPYARLRLQVVSALAGTPAEYAIDYIGEGTWRLNGS